MNWMCPVEERVWENPLAALHHVYASPDEGHGGPESIETPEGPLFPQRTERDAKGKTVEDTLGSGIETFSSDIQQLIKDLEESGFETPPQLDKRALETFRVLDVNDGVLSDLDRIEEDIEYYDRIFTLILQNFDELTGGGSTEVIEETTEETESSEEDDDDEDQTSSGRFSTSDVMEREEREVFKVLEHSTLLDDHTDVLVGIFKFIYEERNTDGVYVDEVADEIDIPPGLAEENLERLDEELNMIRHDADDDRYFVPY